MCSAIMDVLMQATEPKLLSTHRFAKGIQPVAAYSMFDVSMQWRNPVITCLISLPQDVFLLVVNAPSCRLLLLR